MGPSNIGDSGVKLEDGSPGWIAGQIQPATVSRSPFGPLRLTFLTQQVLC